MVSFFKKYKLGFLSLAITWGAYFFYLWPRIFFYRTDGIYSGWRTVWADWAAHMTYANVFAYRSVSDWFHTHPLFVGERFNYPFISSLISGVLMRLGMDPVPAFIWPSQITCIIFLIALFSFYVLILKSQKQAFGALSLFLASGGMGFLAFKSGRPQELTNLPEQNIHWMNTVSSELLPQRSFLLGITLSLIMLCMILRWSRTKFEDISKTKLILLGLFTGSLVLVHAHSFISMVLILAFLFCLNPRPLLSWLWFGVPAAVFGLLLYFTFVRLQNASGFFGWNFGWMANPGFSGFIKFWWMNWGVFLPLALIGTWRLQLFRDPFVLAGIFIWIFCNLFRISPWLWDNTKLLTWSYLLLCIPVIQYLSLIWNHRTHLHRFAATLLFVIATTAGFLDLAYVAQTRSHSHRMWSTEDIKIAREFREISNPTDIVLIVPSDFQNWVLRLSGRQVLMGFPATLWSYGFKYQTLENDVKSMLMGEDEAENLFQKYGVRYAVLGNSEQNDFPYREAYFASKYKKILEGAGFRVYDLRTKSS